MTILRKVFFLHRLVDNLISGKNQEKEDSEIPRFSIYSGFTGSPIFRKFFFLCFFKNHGVLKLFFYIFFFLIKKCPSQKNFGSLALFSTNLYKTNKCLSLRTFEMFWNLTRKNDVNLNLGHFKLINFNKNLFQNLIFF